MATRSKREAFWSEPIGKVDLRQAAVVPSGTTIGDPVKETEFNQIGCMLGGKQTVVPSMLGLVSFHGEYLPRHR